MAHRLTTCTFCGVGCGIYLETQGGRIAGAYPSMSHPTNGGRICVRGWNVHEVASSPDRLREPLVRRRGELVPASWDEAFAHIAENLLALRQKHGPDALAFLNVPRCSNEEAYLLQKLARAVIGTNNVDHGTGVYSHNSIEVLLEMLGVPASTGAVADLDHSDVILVDGVDLAMQLPTIGGRVLRAKLAGARLIVIDARRHRVALHADHFLQVRPGTDVFLYGAMAKVIVDRGLMNRSFIKARVAGGEAFLDAVRHYDLLAAADRCGVPAETIEAAALALARARAATFLFATGAEMRSAESIRGLVNLALLTGHLGRPGAGVFALTEHNNLQGVCDMGMLPDRLPGYGRVEDPLARAPFERQWGVRLPARPGADTREILAGGSTSTIRGAWLGRYDPVVTATFCDPTAALRNLDFLVVQQLFLTATAKLAHVVLPLTAFGEERVSFTSTDRRVQLAEQAIEPRPGLLPAWRQITLAARAMGADWDYATAGDVMDEIGGLVPFYSGANHENLAREYGRQWPCTKDRPLGTSRLFAEGGTPPGFRFAPVPKPAALGGATAEFPLALVFGHSLYYWHQNVLVQHSETLKREYRMLLLDYPEGFVELHPTDATQLGLRDGQPMRVVSARGTVTTTARVTPEVRVGTVFVPFFVREVERQILDPGSEQTGATGRPVWVRVEKA